MRVSQHFDYATFSALLTSNAACGFPRLRSPGCFAPRVIGPIEPGGLYAGPVARGTCCAHNGLHASRLAFRHGAPRIAADMLSGVDVRRLARSLWSLPVTPTPVRLS